MRLRLFLFAFALSLSSLASAQKASDFRVQVDTLRERLKRETTVKTALSLQKVLKRDTELDFYFSQDLSDYPWRKESLESLRDYMEELIPKGYTLGIIFGGKTDVSTLAVPERGRNGNPAAFDFRVEAPKRRAIVTRVGAHLPKRGLAGRQLAVWQSHGRYFDGELWRWQRGPIFRTLEDVYTQSYVLNYLIPMLENAGAYVFTPRERDVNSVELIADNDPAFEERPEGVRLLGKYTEKGAWKDAGAGFADKKEVYTADENPFSMGTVRLASAERDKVSATAIWSASGLPRGGYAVYISYKTLADSSPAVRYTVRHLGGETEFIVNQKMGGGMWIYLGTFDMDSSSEVVLDNQIPSGHWVAAGSSITADAVRIGGGMGKIDRGGGTSGLPCFAEGAMYSMLFSGTPASLFNDWDNDYTRDYAGRGAWTSRLSGGSSVNPKAPGLKVPIDMSIAFHSDAGVTPDSTTVGTLVIYTSKCDNKEELPSGESRLTSRTLVDMVQSQIVDDIRSQFNPDWARRGTWDRSYSESRTTSVPALLLELLSHQNFSDMQYGLDPSFQFAASRSVYKGVLKYLSARYGVKYAVAPLPVESFAAELSPDGKSVNLSWVSPEDSLEPTAAAHSFRIQTRLDGRGFDDQPVSGVKRSASGRYSVNVPIDKGHIYSFRILACNDGGVSFPSETLSAGVPSRTKGTVMVVNNFTRVSGPQVIDTGSYAGFMDNMDSGVPWIRDISYCGEQYQFDRSAEWTSNSDPGFGGSYPDMAGSVIGGNTFDYPYVHGKAIFDAGYAFCSSSVGALGEMSLSACSVMDIICGKQRRCSLPGGPERFAVFSPSLKDLLRAYSSAGGKLIISGAYIASDITPEDVPFLTEVFGYKTLTGFGSRKGDVSGCGVFSPSLRLHYNNEWNRNFYRVEHPDGLSPSGPGSTVLMRYRDTGIPASVGCSGKAVSFGFPLEIVDNPSALGKVVDETLKFLSK